LVLHPSFKTTYFREAGWPDAWVDSAKKTLIQHWEDWYKPKEVVPDSAKEKEKVGVDNTFDIF
ncbi:hypothetical protein K435DRAFT_676576, partial [Dendrothele bispora CBS 962.96]